MQVHRAQADAAQATTPSLVVFDAVAPVARGAPALRPVSFAVEAGTIHALVGPNGAGKTSLLRALLGEVEFTGSIRLEWRGAATIGYVPQRFVVEPTLALTVGEFLALTRQRRPVCVGVTAAASARIGAALRLVELDGFERRPLAELSGGELRRVLLAHALEPRPELLLLDEPAEGFDRAALVRFESLLVDARARGATTLLVTHERALVERVADATTDLGDTASGELAA